VFGSTTALKSAGRTVVAKFKLLVLIALAIDAPRACGNDLLEIYRLALARDAVLQAATHQRDAAIEGRPQALSQLLPQVAASASTGREREGQQTTVVSTDQAATWNGMVAD
jgi:outer membrane protein TolC